MAREGLPRCTGGFQRDSGTLKANSSAGVHRWSVNLAAIAGVRCTHLASCGTIHMRTKYLLWVHWRFLWISKSREFASEPYFFTSLLSSPPRLFVVTPWCFDKGISPEASLISSRAAPKSLKYCPIHHRVTQMNINPCIRLHKISSLNPIYLCSSVVNFGL